jgi:Rad3-related DNA helicase
MSETGDGWTKVLSNQRLSQVALDRLPWPQRQVYELQVIREWETNPDAHWSGMYV